MVPPEEATKVHARVGQPQVSAEAIRTVSSRTGHRPALRNVVSWMAVGALPGVGYMIYQEHHEPSPCALREGFCGGGGFGPSDGVVVASISLIGAGLGALVDRIIPAEEPVVTARTKSVRVSLCLGGDPVCAWGATRSDSGRCVSLASGRRAETALMLPIVSRAAPCYRLACRAMLSLPEPGRPGPGRRGPSRNGPTSIRCHNPGRRAGHHAGARSGCLNRS